MPALEFGDWMPDQAEIGAAHLRVAKNCIPQPGLYAPLPGLMATTDALGSRCRGVFPVRDTDNAARMYAGDADDLYELVGSTWTNRSNGSGYTSAGSTTRWRSTTFGDRLIVTNGLDDPQYIDMSTGASAFADLAGAPGIAKFVATYGEFVFLGALGSNPMTIKWSGIGDSEGWTVGVGLSDEQEFADGGTITGFASTRAALYLFQEKCIRRILFVGGDVIMQIDKLIENIGCIEPNSLVQYGQRCFFLSEDGWYMWDFESQPAAIGLGRFDKWFLSNAQRSYWYAMSAVIDPKNRVLACGFAGGASDALTHVLFYNYEIGRATYAEVNHEMLVPAIGLATSLDDLTGDLDADYDISFDDPYWLGGAFYFAAINATHKMASFSGDNLEATLETNAQAMFDGERSGVRWIKPLADTIDATCAAGAKVRPGDTITFPSAVAQQDSGKCPQRGANGFYHAARMVVPAASTWTWAKGVEFEPNGLRGIR